MATPMESDTSVKSGFPAHLKGISVAELIQLNWLTGSACCVRILSQHKIAWIHFGEGKILHAATGNLEGDAAVLEDLGWQDGTLEPSTAQGPSTPTKFPAYARFRGRSATSFTHSKPRQPRSAGRQWSCPQFKRRRR